MSSTSRLYTRGVNFMGQLGLLNGYQNISKFTEVAQLKGRQINQIEAHFAHSFCRLDDGQILHWGYVLDSLTSTRVVNYYKGHPSLCKFWQKFSPFGKTLSLRLGDEQVNLLNSKTIGKKLPKKFSSGGGFLHILHGDGTVYGLGENYKGQLGTGDLGFKHHFEQIKFDTKEKIVDISCGHQHSIFLTESGYLFGSGRANWHQIMPYLKEDQKERVYVDFHKTPKRMIIKNEKVKKISAGFSHTIFLTHSNKIYGLGLNNHGQCGSSNLTKTTCDAYNPVFTDLDADEYIIDIAAGKSHNVYITNKNKIYMFGATLHNQLARKPEFDIDQCSPSEVHIKMEQNEKAISVKAGFDRTAILTDQGNCYVWGGENLLSIGAEDYTPVKNIRNEIEDTSIFIEDIALGYLHTLVKGRS